MIRQAFGLSLIMTALFLWMFLTTISLLGCSSGGPIVYNGEGVNPKLSQSVADFAADKAELYFKEHYGKGEGWTAHSSIWNLRPEKIHSACPLSPEQKSEGWTEAAGCTVSPWMIVVNDEANPCQTIVHELAHIAGYRFFDDYDYSHASFADYYNRYVFEVCQ